MKIEWKTVFEVAIGVLIGGAVLVVLNGLFFHFLSEMGEKIHDTPAPAKAAV